jgi:hypothetical protein
LVLSLLLKRYFHIFDKLKIRIKKCFLMIKSLYTYLLFILFLALPLTSIAQRIKINDAHANREEKKIFIPYEIEESSKYHNLYKIALYYTQDKGKTYQGPLQKVTGDIGKEVTPGDKLIVWEYAEEDSTFNGEGVMFKLAITSRLDPRYLGGPENALYSLLLPGLGNTKVRPPAKKWYLVSAGVFSLIGGGVYMGVKSNQTLDLYRESTTTQEAQDLFDKANNQKTVSGSLFVAAGAIWLTDIIQVAIKGFKNKKAARELEPIPSTPKTTPELGLHFDQFQNQTLWGIRLKF